MSKFKVGDKVQFANEKEMHERLGSLRNDKDFSHVTLETAMVVKEADNTSIYVDFGKNWPFFNISDTRLKLAEEKPKAPAFKIGDEIVFVSQKDLDEWKSKGHRDCREIRSQVKRDTTLRVHAVAAHYGSVVVELDPIYPHTKISRHHIEVSRVKLAPVASIPAGSLVTFKTGQFELCHRHKRMHAEGARYNTLFEVVGPGYTDRSVLIRIAGRKDGKAHPVKITRLLRITQSTPLVDYAKAFAPELARRNLIEAMFPIVSHGKTASFPLKKPGLPPVFTVLEEGNERQSFKPVADQSAAIERAKREAKVCNTRQFVFKLVAVVEPPVVPEPLVEFVAD